MKKSLFCLLFSALCLLSLSPGCATSGGRGRIALVEWDSRSPEQLVAAQSDAAVVFAGQQAEAKSEVKALPVGWFDGLMAMMSGIRVRLSALRVEWSSVPSDPATAHDLEVNP